MYCFINIAFSVNKELPFVQGMQVQIKHIYNQIQAHENFQLHNEAVQSYIKVKSNKDISSLTNIDQKNVHLLQVKERRLFLLGIIEGIRYISRQGIAYRAHHGVKAYTLENRTINHGNFLELLLCWSKFDAVLKKHIKIAIYNSKKRKERLSIVRRRCLMMFLSKTTINTIIHIISQIIQNEIIKEVQDATFFSIFIDSSQDIRVTLVGSMCLVYNLSNS